MSEAQTQEAATLSRAIKMSMFGTARKVAELKLAAAQLEAKGEPATNAPPLTLGQIAGRIAAVEVKEIVSPNGEVSELWYATGEFEAVVYETSKVMESPTANLPRYYLEGVKALLDKGAQAVVCGIEIVLVATGKQIPIAYEVRNLIPREADNPINRVKAALAKAGKLRLPPPSSDAPSGALEGPPAADELAAEPSTSDKARVDGKVRPRPDM